MFSSLVFPVLSYLLRLALAPISVTAPAAELPALDCPARFGLKDEGSRAVDVRWADEDSVYILRSEYGATRNRLADGMPEVERVLPGKRQQPRIHRQNTLAVSEDFLLSGSFGDCLWRRNEPSSGGFNIRSSVVGGFGDLDIQGDRLALLGIPGPENWRRFPNGTVWVGRVEDEAIVDFEPVVSEPQGSTAKQRRVNDYIVAGAGSLRFLEDGSLFVFLGYRPQALLISPQGRAIRNWDLNEFGLADEESDRLLEVGSDTDFQPRQRRWRSHAHVIDEVLILRNDPAVIVRKSSDGAPVWTLTILEPTGSRSYRIPVNSADPGSRLRGDVGREKRIVLLMSDRSSGELQGQQEVVLCAVPEP